MTWNSMTPRRSSSRAASSRAEWADSKLVCGVQGGSRYTPDREHALLHTHSRAKKQAGKRRTYTKMKQGDTLINSWLLLFSL